MEGWQWQTQVEISRRVLCLVARSCPTLCDSMDCSQPGSVHGDSAGKNTGMGSNVLLQGIFPTHGLNPGLPHCRQILYYLSHKGSLRILEWVAYPFSGGSSWPRNWTRVSCIAGGFFTSWATGEAHKQAYVVTKLETWFGRIYIMDWLLKEYAERK